MSSREQLLRRIGDINNPSTPRPLVTLEEFFIGNEDYASIGYNLPDSPSPQEFFALLKFIRDRDGVADVRVEVKDLEDADGWPSTDTIWIITSKPLDVVRTWLPERVAPDDWLDGCPTDVEAYKVPAGMKAIGAWYD